MRRAYSHRHLNGPFWTAAAVQGRNRRRGEVGCSHVFVLSIRSPTNVCFGSKAEMASSPRHVCFIPDNGHYSRRVGGPLCAINGHPGSDEAVSALFFPVDRPHRLSTRSRWIALPRCPSLSLR